jgi:outer membrane lipoprotein carrier protein
MRLAGPVGLAVGLSLAASGSIRGATDRTADELARALQRQYASVRDFSADFVQSYTGGVLHKQVVEKGHLLVKKPGLMRWEYTQPEKKIFVSDGARTYLYVPEDRQVFVSRAPAADDADTSVLFLAGKGDIVRDFETSIADVPPGLPPGTQALKLVPRSKQREYDWLVIAFAQDSLRLRGLVTTDTQGGTSSFVFENLKENVSPPLTQFRFDMPRGVDIVTEGPAGASHP